MVATGHKHCLALHLREQQVHPLLTLKDKRLSLSFSPSHSLPHIHAHSGMSVFHENHGLKEWEKKV